MHRGGDLGSLLTREWMLVAFLISVIAILALSSILLSNPPEEKALCSGSAECFEGTVTRIVDGDTLYVDDIKIRLALVDTPEEGEEGYEEASQFAESLCPVGSQAMVDQDDWQLYDRYGRMLAVVHCGEKNLNKELLDEGHAFILTRYCDESEFGNQEWARDYGC